MAGLLLATILAAGVSMEAAPAKAAKPVGAVAEITALRARSNAAIAAHDRGLMSLVEGPGYTLLAGSSGTPLQGSDIDAGVTAGFQDPTFITYVRTPGKITVGKTGKRAAEVGTWLGRWRKPDGEMRVTGVYQAMWTVTPDGWRLKNESYVTLGCTGSTSCSEID